MVESILQQATNLLGEIDRNVKDRIKRHLVENTRETWDDIHGLIVGGHRTIWQGWIAIDPDAPNSTPGDRGAARWLKYPDPFTTVRAIKHVIELEQQSV